MTASRGRIDAIWVKPARREPMDRVQRTHLVAGRGLEGNAHRGGRRQVTLITREKWAEVEEELGESVDPVLRRANLLVRGVRLQESVGRVLAVGDARVLIHGETTPCRRMDEGRPGLQEALRPRWRGGAFGAVLRGAPVRVGDPVTWVEALVPGERSTVDHSGPGVSGR